MIVILIHDSPKQPQNETHCNVLQYSGRLILYIPESLL